MLLCDWWILVNAYPHVDDVKVFDNLIYLNCCLRPYRYPTPKPEETREGEREIQCASLGRHER